MSTVCETFSCTHVLLEIYYFESVDVNIAAEEERCNIEGSAEVEMWKTDGEMSGIKSLKVIAIFGVS